MKAFVTILSLAAFGCACSTTEPMRVTAPVQLEPIVDRFIADCRKTLPENVCSPPIKLYISVSPILETGTIGQCTTYNKPFEDVRYIELEPEVVTGYQLWSVMYHELFHCVMNKPHYDAEYDIMNTFEHKEVTKIIYGNWDFFVQRVFQRE